MTSEKPVANAVPLPSWSALGSTTLMVIVTSYERTRDAIAENVLSLLSWPDEDLVSGHARDDAVRSERLPEL